MMFRVLHADFRSKRIAGAALALAMLTGLAAQGTAAFAEAPVNPELAAARRAYEASEYMDAMRLARPLADQGNQAAQYLMGQMYFFGLGVERNDAQALQWYTGPAQAGNPDAQYRLGYLYATGQGVAYNPAQAERWWLEAAKKSHIGAVVALADFYHEGLYAKENEQRARMWLNRAAVMGDTEAMYKLAGRLMKPERLATDFRRAYAWFYIAAYRGHASAKNFIDKNQRFFAPHEVRRGEIWGKAFIQRGTPVPAPPGES